MASHTEGEEAGQDGEGKRGVAHRRRRHYKRHRKPVSHPEGKTKQDVEALLRQVDLDAMLGTANLELPPSLTPADAEAEPPPAEELSQTLLEDEESEPSIPAPPAAPPVPPVGGKKVEDTLRAVDLDAILGEIKPQHLREGELSSAEGGEGSASEEPRKGEFLPLTKEAPHAAVPPAEREKILSVEAHPTRPGQRQPGFWERFAFWRRSAAPGAHPALSRSKAAEVRMDIPLGADSAAPGKEKTAKAEEQPGAPVDLDAVLQAQEKDGGKFLQPQGGTFIRKQMLPPPSPGMQPAPLLSQAADAAPPRELTPEEKQQLEGMRKRQQEDEKALREQAEKHRKEEEAQKKKELEAAQQVQVPSTALPKKRLSLRSRENIFVGITNTLRHVGMGKERFQIIQNLATMLNAGLPLIDSLRTLQMETHNRQARALIQRIVDRVESGSPLWRAMQMEHFFTPDALALVRIGEEAGNLAENMQYLSGQQEKDEALRGKVKMAMIYPAIVLVLMIIVIMGLGMFVLPNLISVLSSLNVPLPLVTRLLIGFTNMFAEHGTTILPATIAISILLAILVKYTPLQIVFQWFIFRIPGIGALLWEATIARFGVIVGGLLQAGVPLVDSLRSLVDVTTIIAYQRFYQRLLDHILVGDSFSKSFAAIRGSNKLLPLSVQQLVMTGERTGSLSKIMLKIADIYEKKANETAQKLPVILEPMLLLFIGALVGTIAFAIIVPIYSIVGSVNQ